MFKSSVLVQVRSGRQYTYNIPYCTPYVSAEDTYVLSAWKAQAQPGLKDRLRLKTQRQLATHRQEVLGLDIAQQLLQLLLVCVTCDGRER